MAAIALFVSEQRFKQYTSVDSNVRDEDIAVYILQAQQMYAQDTLGTRFYNRITEGIVNNNLTSDEQTLLNDYIAPMTIQYGYYLMLPTLKYKIVDKGVVSGTSEETSSTSLDELKYLRQIALDSAQFYTKRLREYLLDNPSMFEEWQNPGTDGMYPNKTNPYFSGLVVPGGPRNKPSSHPGCDECDDTTTIK
jgi:hypothetical protein